MRALWPQQLLVVDYKNWKEFIISNNAKCKLKVTCSLEFGKSRISTDVTHYPRCNKMCYGLVCSIFYSNFLISLSFIRICKHDRIITWWLNKVLKYLFVSNFVINLWSSRFTVLFLLMLFLIFSFIIFLNVHITFLENWSYESHWEKCSFTDLKYDSESIKSKHPMNNQRVWKSY